MDNITLDAQSAYFENILRNSAATNSASIWMEVGPNIVYLANTSTSFLAPPMFLPYRVKLFWDQLEEYEFLSGSELVDLRDLLTSCTRDEQEMIWEICQRSFYYAEAIQLFIDTGLADVFVNSQSSLGTIVVMEAVELGDFNMLALLQKIPTLELNQTFPNGDTLLIRSVKKGNTAIFDLLVNDPRVDALACDTDGNTACKYAEEREDPTMKQKMIERIKRDSETKEAAREAAKEANKANSRCPDNCHIL